MSLDTFGGIKAEIALRLARSDKAALIPGFVQIAHIKMMNGHKRNGAWMVPPLRYEGNQATAALTPADGKVTLPADYLEMKRIETNAHGARPLDYMPPEQFRGSGLYTSSGVPSFYTIEGRTLLIAPANTGELSALYYRRLPTPAADIDTNAIMTDAPMAYLYGGLAEAFAQIRNVEQAGYYEIEFAGAVAGLNESASIGQASGGSLVMRAGTIA